MWRTRIKHTAARRAGLALAVGLVLLGAPGRGLAAVGDAHEVRLYLDLDGVVFHKTSDERSVRIRPWGRSEQRFRTEGLVYLKSFAGFLGGLLGVGGGNFIVPVLVWLGINPKKASATTSFIVVFSSFSGFLGHATLGSMSYSLLGLTAVGSALGAVAGAWLVTDKLKRSQVKVVIGVVLLAVAAKMLYGLLF